MQNYPTKVDNVSTEPAAEYNNLASELKNVVESLGITLSVGSIIQLAQSIGIYSLIGKYYTDGGVADTYVLTAAPVTREDPDQYYIGMEVYFLPDNTNTGASIVNVASLGVKNIVQKDGSSALTGGELTANEFERLIYDGTNFRIVSTDIVDATNTIKGIANFPAVQFTVSSGAVTIIDATTSVKGVASFNTSDFSLIAGAVSLLGGVSALNWPFDSGWYTSNNATTITKAHGISLTFPADGLQVLNIWRVNSGGSYHAVVGIDSDHGAADGTGGMYGYDGTNIYLRNSSLWARYIAGSGAGNYTNASNGELRTFARKLA